MGEFGVEANEEVVVVQAGQDAGARDGGGEVGYVAERCGCGCGLRVSFHVGGEEVVQGGARIGLQNMVDCVDAGVVRASIECYVCVLRLLVQG